MKKLFNKNKEKNAILEDAVYLGFPPYEPQNKLIDLIVALDESDIEKDAYVIQYYPNNLLSFTYMDDYANELEMYFRMNGSCFETKFDNHGYIFSCVHQAVAFIEHEADKFERMQKPWSI